MGRVHRRCGRMRFTPDGRCGVQPGLGEEALGTKPLPGVVRQWRAAFQAGSFLCHNAIRSDPITPYTGKYTEKGQTFRRDSGTSTSLPQKNGLRQVQGSTRPRVRARQHPVRAPGRRWSGNGACSGHPVYRDRSLVAIVLVILVVFVTLIIPMTRRDFVAAQP